MSGVDFSDPDTIASLAAALQVAGIDGIEIEQPARKVRIVVERGALRAAPQVKAPHQSSRTTQSGVVTAPIAGIFCIHHPASVASPFELPREVVIGDTLGFVRVGTVLLQIKATQAGVLTGNVAGDGSLVGYGDPLFEIEPRP